MNKTQESVSKATVLLLQNGVAARHWWLPPVILATQEAEIRMIKI
jgi:hypothetical protein